MLNGLKNFAINRILRHVADNPKLNKATNVLAVIPAVLTAMVGAGANWALMFQCCAAEGSLQEVLRVGGLAAMAVLLFFCGKVTWLSQWLPVAQEIIEEAEREIVAGAPGKK